MAHTSIESSFTGISRIKLFFALSRTPHGLLDMTTPAFGALLWLGAFPSLKVILLGLLTTFSGYTAVYALNDLVDYRSDKAKIKAGGNPNHADYLDAAMIRHPMAQGLLSLGEGLLWVAAWSAVALVGAYLLNPVCVIIFVGGCALETVYCLLLRVSSFRTLVSGAVKTSGAMAAVFAVDPSPSWIYCGILFLCLFFWEIGAQNIPHDWADIEDDRRFGAKTIPVRWGAGISASLIMGALVLSFLFLILLLFLPAMQMGWVVRIMTLAVCAWLLLLPAYQLLVHKSREKAMILFNRASYFPLSMLVMVLLHLVLSP